jgi:glycosyltransferase involved in cell wall biosynthesis
MDEVEFSVLVTCYYEEKSIDEFHARLSATLERTGRPYEIIMVNDGSLDDTWGKLRAIYARDPHVLAVLDMFRNFGQQAAVTAALNESRGRAIVVIDSDLQLSPEDLPALIAEYDRGADIVSGYRENRQDPLTRIVPSLLANAIMRHASRSSIRDFGCTFKIYRADLMRAFHYGPHRSISAVEVISRAGRIVEVPVSHRPRKYGKSGWTLSKLMKYNTDNLVLLSERPFQISATVAAMFAGVLILRVVLDSLFPIRLLPIVTNGLILNVVLIALVINVALLSLVGEFSIRSFLRSRNVPQYIVRDKLSRAGEAPVHSAGERPDEPAR